MISLLHSDLKMLFVHLLLLIIIKYSNNGNKDITHNCFMDLHIFKTRLTCSVLIQKVPEWNFRKSYRITAINRVFNGDFRLQLTCHPYSTSLWWLLWWLKLGVTSKILQCIWFGKTWQIIRYIKSQYIFVSLPNRSTGSIH